MQQREPGIFLITSLSCREIFKIFVMVWPTLYLHKNIQASHFRKLPNDILGSIGTNFPTRKGALWTNLDCYSPTYTISWILLGLICSKKLPFVVDLTKKNLNSYSNGLASGKLVVCLHLKVCKLSRLWELRTRTLKIKFCLSFHCVSFQSYKSHSLRL